MVGEALAEAGYHTATRRDGDELEEALDGLRPDLVVLDVMLPGRDGFALIDVIREWGDIGIVLITARDALQDRLRGPDGGADDYVVKPFELAELVSRVGAVLRRRGRLPQAVQVGDLMLDVDAGVAARDGHRLDLTGTELRLLTFLVEQRGSIVNAGQILNAVLLAGLLVLLGVTIDVSLGIVARRNLHDRLLVATSRADALAAARTPADLLAAELNGGGVRALLIGAGVATLLLATLLVVAVSRAALRPLDRLTALADDITTGDRGRRLHPDRADTELGRAAGAFDRMLDALEESERQARQAADAARRAEAATRRFLADAAHGCAPRSRACRRRPNRSPAAPAGTGRTPPRAGSTARPGCCCRTPAAPGDSSPTCWI